MSRLIRELERMLESSTEPTSRIDLLNQLIIERRDNDPAESLTLCRDVLRRSRELKYSRGIAHALLSEGYLLDFQGEKREALEKLDEAYALFAELGDNEGLGYCCKYLCW